MPIARRQDQRRRLRGACLQVDVCAAVDELGDASEMAIGGRGSEWRQSGDRLHIRRAPACSSFEEQLSTARLMHMRRAASQRVSADRSVVEAMAAASLKEPVRMAATSCSGVDVKVRGVSSASSSPIVPS